MPGPSAGGLWRVQPSRSMPFGTIDAVPAADRLAIALGGEEQVRRARDQPALDAPHLGQAQAQQRGALARGDRELALQAQRRGVADVDDQRRVADRGQRREGVLAAEDDGVVVPRRELAAPRRARSSRAARRRCSARRAPPRPSARPSPKTSRRATDGSSAVAGVRAGTATAARQRQVGDLVARPRAPRAGGSGAGTRWSAATGPRR